MSEEIFRNTIQVLKEQRNVALDSLVGAVTENRILQHRLAISDNKILELNQKFHENYKNKDIIKTDIPVVSIPVLGGYISDVKTYGTKSF